MIKGLLFDNYKVLVFSPDRDVPSVLAARQMIAARLNLTVPELGEAVYQGEHSSAAYVGKINTEQFWQNLFAQQQQKIPSLQEARQIDHQFWWGATTPVYNEPLLMNIRNLARIYQTAILSDAWDNIHRDWQEQNFPTELFQQIFISYQTGLRKPNPRFFEFALTQMQLLPQEVIFTDDILDNVTAARQLGLFAIQYQNFNQWQSDFRALLEFNCA